MKSGFVVAVCKQKASFWFLHPRAQLAGLPAGVFVLDHMGVRILQGSDT